MHVASLSKTSLGRTLQPSLDGQRRGLRFIWLSGSGEPWSLP